MTCLSGQSRTMSKIKVLRRQPQPSRDKHLSLLFRPHQCNQLRKQQTILYHLLWHSSILHNSLPILQCSRPFNLAAFHPSLLLLLLFQSPHHDRKDHSQSQQPFRIPCHLCLLQFHKYSHLHKEHSHHFLQRHNRPLNLAAVLPSLLLRLFLPQPPHHNKKLHCQWHQPSHQKLCNKRLRCPLQPAAHQQHHRTLRRQGLLAKSGDNWDLSKAID
mmetsp:Transcript_34709/g.58141  ORF Transcript_34709/g.58141 Transcript_34709/m.58141 type:complete len:215 (+) Transcript_34709:692-1336(+)